MTLLLHVLMLFLLSSGSAEVVPDFAGCREFFANGQSPTTFIGSQYKHICQTQNDVVHFATYYDTDNRIPVYSAYKFEGIMGCTRLDKWYIEPQLDNKHLGANMAFQRTVNKEVRGEHQALNRDYKNSSFEKGHLAPVYQARSQSCADATFTLTNAAPQDKYFNSPLWWNVEETLATFLRSRCSQHAYIVTGVVPGSGTIKNRVKVPSHFWTAFCCLDQNNRCSHSGGVIGTNDRNSFIVGTSVAFLERVLQNLYRTTFRVFQ